MASLNQITNCSTTASTIVQTTPSPVPLLASTTTSKENATTKSVKDVCNNNRKGEKTIAKTLLRPAKFIPPPPPPRRLLLTQTQLKTSGQIQNPLQHLPLQRKFGASADDGFSVGAIEDGDVCAASKDTHKIANTSLPPCTATTKMTMTTTMTTTTMTTTTMTTTTTTTRLTKIPQPQEDVCNIKKYSAINGCQGETVLSSTKVRPSSTIIETSLLGSGEPTSSQSPLYNSSTIALTMREKLMHPAAIITKSEDQQQLEKKDKVRKEKRIEQKEVAIDKDSKSACAQPVAAGSALSPRLEMRLALNHDILGDEDLISYDPGPDLTTILGHDLSTFQRRTGRDLLNRSATNRVQPKEAVISFSQQRNSKMDTPTVNRRPRPQLNNSSPASSMPFVGSARVGGVPQHLQPNRNTWSSSVSVVQARDGSANGASSNKNINYNRDDNKLSDLEILARREKIYCTSQLRSGSQVKMGTKMMTSKTTMMKSKDFCHNSNHLTMTTNTTSMGVATEELLVMPKMAKNQRKIGRDETALMESGKANKLINFIKRHNLEYPPTANNSQISLNDSNASSTPQHKQIPMSPRKDNDKPSLNRRLWKQITKRRRSNSVSELVAS